MVRIDHLLCTGPHTAAVHPGSLPVYHFYEPSYYRVGTQSGLEEPADSVLGRDAWRSIPGVGTFHTVTHQRGAAFPTPQPDPVHHFRRDSGHLGFPGVNPSVAHPKIRARR